MSRQFAAAFGVTVGILVPAAWHGTDATIEKDGKKVRPLQKDFMVDGARVTLEVDHNLVETGDNVIAKLRAYSDEPKKVAVDLTVMQSDDTFGSRVSSPPRAVDKEHFTLEATPDGGKVVMTKIAMKPNAGSDKIDWFRIYAAAKGTKIDVYGGDGGDGDGPPSVAAIGVLGWSTNDFGMTIKSKGKMTSAEPFEVSVRVENTTTQTLKHAPYVHLGTSVGLYGLEEGEDFTIEEADDNRDYDKKWRPGDTEIVKFTVTPKHEDVKRVTFVASAFSWDEGEPGPIVAGSMEARSFKIQASQVAAK
jgi:hypothetical protein